MLALKQKVGEDNNIVTITVTIPPLIQQWMLLIVFTVPLVPGVGNRGWDGMEGVRQNHSHEATEETH